MEVPLDFQKMCQIPDIRKLLFLTSIIAFLVILVQFLSIPYGSVLLSVFPSGKVPLIGTFDHSAGDSYLKSLQIVGISPLSDSISSGSSVLVTNTDESDLGANTNHTDDGNGIPDNDSGLEEDIDNNTSSKFWNLEDSHNGSISNKAREPEHGPPLREMSLDNVQKQSSALTLERAQGGDSSFVPLAPALPPVDSPANLTLPRKMNANLSTTVISENSNVSSVGEQSAITLSKDKKPETVGTGQATSQKNSTMTTNSIQKSSSLEKPPRPVTSISEMSLLLLKSRVSSRSMIPRWPSIRDQEILSAKSQIENAPILKNDPDLYAPLYHNISMFKRSYELMEQTLKVYIYKEGARPIFHQPETKGIYASEGWFMKQMEGNKQFSVSDPRKAHLFYFPFSTRRLEQFLYVPNSHSHKNLVEHLKNYLDLISAKYPFWNRTGGADHFLVACHDWAPAETTQHMSNCIRAMCNADISEDFAMGKDASLPETNIRLAKDPLRDLGGKPPSKREILAFFAGSMHGYLRPTLLQHWENKDPDMQIHGHMGRSGKHKSIYAQHMKNSKYCICAKGFEVNSPRVIEAISYECVPVIISDNFVPPFFEVLNWEAFAVFIPEKDIPNLKNILLSIPEERYLRLQMRVKKVQRHFLWHPKPVKYDIFHMILHSVWYNRVFQINLG